nr:MULTISPECIES: hypothetical protein [unclassified Brevundimonas]
MNLRQVVHSAFVDPERCPDRPIRLRLREESPQARIGFFFGCALLATPFGCECIGQIKEVIYLPNRIDDPGFHRWSQAFDPWEGLPGCVTQGLTLGVAWPLWRRHQTVVSVDKRQRQMTFMVLRLLRERIGATPEPTVAHAQV